MKLKKLKLRSKRVSQRAKKTVASVQRITQGPGKAAGVGYTKNYGHSSAENRKSLAKRWKTQRKKWPIYRD